MGKPPLRWKGIGGKNKDIRKERKKPLPLELMKGVENDKTDRIRSDARGNGQNPFIDKVI